GGATAPWNRPPGAPAPGIPLFPGPRHPPGGLKLSPPPGGASPPLVPPPTPPPALLSDEICGGLVITPLACTVLRMTVYCTGAVSRVRPGAAVSAACWAGDLMVVDTSSPPTDAITASPTITSRTLRRRRRRPCPGLSTAGTSTPTHPSAANSCHLAPIAGCSALLPHHNGPAKMSTCQRAIGFRDPGLPLPLYRRRVGPRCCLS